jgi:putative two-component system response regulator
MAVADVYDALISRRVYKAPMSHDEACRIIIDGRGQHFDPDLVDAFAGIAGTFHEIAQRYDDSE